MEIKFISIKLIKVIVERAVQLEYKHCDSKLVVIVSIFECSKISHFTCTLAIIDYRNHPKLS